MSVTKTAAKAVNLPVGSATALLTWANDAANWSGAPMVNDTFGKSTGGYVAKLQAAGMVVAHEDGEETFVSFTDAGIDAAIALGAESHFAASVGRTEKVTAKVCKKNAAHGVHRATKTGSYCYACDRIAAGDDEATAIAKAEAKRA